MTRDHKIAFEHATRRLFSVAEVIVYVAVGLAFLAAAAAMLCYSVGSAVAHYEERGVPLTVVTLINDLLLVLIIMEVLRTVASYIEEQGASLRPFLFIATISATRRILAIGAEMSVNGEQLSADQFRRSMIDLGANAGAILVLAIALYLLASRETAARETPPTG